MRTCPACGEDTKAGYAEACTECGFSAAGEQMPEAEPVPEVAVETSAAPEPGGEPAEQPPPPQPGAEPQPPPPTEPPPTEPTEKKKRSPARFVIWLVVIAGFFGADRLGVFDTATGPTADEVEAAIADSAEQIGLREATVECPDDAEDTPVEETFTCTVTSRRGNTVEIVVTNHEESFEWETGPLTTLR